MYFIIMALLGAFVLAATYINVRHGRTIGRKRMLVLVLLGFLAFTTLGDECEDTNDVTRNGVGELNKVECEHEPIPQWCYDQGVIGQ